MTGVNQAGLPIVREARLSRWGARSVSVSELTGLDGRSDRDAAIIGLAIGLKWSCRRLAPVFGMTERRVQQILRDYQRDCSEALG
jgi:hypothetical protein